MYVPLILTLHICLTFGVLTHLALKAPLAFRGVRAAILIMALLAAWNTPLVSLLLIVPVVAANQFRFVSVPNFLDFSRLFPDTGTANG